MEFNPIPNVAGCIAGAAGEMVGHDQNVITASIVIREDMAIPGPVKPAQLGNAQSRDADGPALLLVAVAARDLSVLGLDCGH
jgi:hypothetical protein